MKNKILNKLTAELNFCHSHIKYLDNVINDRTDSHLDRSLDKNKLVANLNSLLQHRDDICKQINQTYWDYR